MFAVYRVKDNEASVLTTLMWVVPREDTYNPLVPVWDGSFFIFKEEIL